MNRRQAREKTFLIIYQYKFQPDYVYESLNDFFAENKDKLGEQADYISKTVDSTLANLKKIDGLIEEYSKGWSVERISSVSLAAMRLSVCEMLYIKDIPHSVSINEAVSLVKEYEGDEAAPFVNGILGGIQKSICLT